jgi:hypothetical protein
VWFESETPDDVSRELRMIGHFGYIVVFAVKLARTWGPLDLEVDGVSVQVDEHSDPAFVSAKLRES